ncbi:PH domain-containing protein [Xenorhabdus sp. XENO-1]|uniref:PH domain-containing protein n=1 Tax=Xenorhabdus bovienii TaxID=40576 RepID=UPI0020CA8165|nr:PH domain-containing protein [Xenorhabdus bovienii]MCP9267815.1 PH domain-containing protein [Xenorhabdus bovienii subsp. africana]
MINYQTASKEELQNEFKRLAKEVSDTPFGVKKEFFHLPKILGANETPLAIASGFMDGNTWLITLTNKRVIFLDKGMLFGVTQVDINLDDVASVAGKTGLIFGEITISTTAQNFTISNVLKATVIPFTNLVNKAKDDKKNSTTYNVNHNYQPETNKDDIVSKLERLATLKEKGILSNEEFLTQKEKILNS